MVFNASASSDAGGVHGSVDLGVDPEALSVPPRRLPLAALIALVASATTALAVFANAWHCQWWWWMRMTLA